MKIVHVGSAPSPLSVNGVNTTIWLASKEQALLGNHVTLLIDSPPDDDAKEFAQDGGINLECIPASSFTYDSKKIRDLFKSEKPDLVHLHSIFLPKQAVLCRYLVKESIPYVITPNAICPQLLQRGKVKKSLYSWLVEKPRFQKAVGITAVTPREEKDISHYIPDYKGKTRYIPNPVDSSHLAGEGWEMKVENKKIVYLGRYDVLHKGIDFLFDIARFLPESVEVHLYGTKDAKTQAWFDKLQENMPANIVIHGPVFGADKLKALTEASIYIQTSRWEVFGISIAEAMYLGIPCAVADTVNLSDIFKRHDLGYVLPSDAKTAATELSRILDNASLLHDWSNRSKAYAEKFFGARTVAESFLDFYQEVI